MIINPSDIPDSPIIIDEKKRSKEIWDFAADHFFHFRETETIAYPQFVLFSNGNGPQIRNHIYKTIDRVEVEIFDHRYREEPGVLTQTVMCFWSKEMTLPGFILHPRDMADPIPVLRHKPIKFSGHADFSKSYTVTGNDNAKIRNIFTPAVMSFFDLYKGRYVEAKGDTLLYCISWERVEPGLMKLFFNEGRTVFRLFQKARE